jgi:DNA-binding phage protein
LKITLTRKDIIEKFLIKILNDNDMRFISDLHKVFGSVKSKENNNYLYKGRVYLRNILEINTFLSRILHDIDSQDLFFNLILKISNF